MRRASLVLAVLALAAFTAHADSNKNISRTFDVGDGGTIHLDADAGDVHVTSGGGGHVTVEVVERRTGDRFDLTFDQKGSDVYVRSRDSEHEHGRFWSFRWNDSSWVTFTIHVPSRYNLDLHTSGGSITSGDVGGNAELHTSGGNISTGRINGTLIARSSGGDIKIEGASGRVDAHTRGGDVEIHDAASSVEAKSSGGSIEIRRAVGSVLAHTSGGGIRIEDALDTVDATTSGGSITARFSRQPHADSRLSTSGGGVTVELAPSIGAELDAHASGGGVHSDMPITIQGTQDEDSLVGKINGGGPRLILRTSGGGITVRRG
jgi:hypothetical protein